MNMCSRWTCSAVAVTSTVNALGHRVGWCAAHAPSRQLPHPCTCPTCARPYAVEVPS